MTTQRTLADRLALPLLLLGAISISFSGIFVKLSEVGPTSTAFFRMFLPLPLMAVGMMLATRQYPGNRLPGIGRRGWIGIHVAAFFLAFDLIVWHWSLKFMAVGVSTLLGNTAPIWVALIGFLFFKERFAARFLIGLGLAMLGVVLLVVGSGRSFEVNDWLGLVLGVLAAVGYAGYLHGVRIARGSVGITQVMFWTSALTAAWLLPVALLSEDQVVPRTLSGWLAVAGLAIISQSIGQSLISWALGHLPASFSSVTLLLNPVASGVFAWILLGEALMPPQIAGGFAVLVGIFVARPRPRLARPQPATKDASSPKPVAPST